MFSYGPSEYENIIIIRYISAIQISHVVVLFSSIFNPDNQNDSNS